MDKQRILTMISVGWLWLLWGNAAWSGVTWSFNYLDGNFPDEAKADLAAVGRILGGWLKTTSTVTIAIDVRGFDKKGGSLGSASSGKANYHTNFDRTVVQHKILSGQDVNGAAADGEVNVNFNSGYRWGYGDEIPKAKMDFKAMLIHEFVHTMGFAGDIDPPDAAKTGDDRVTKWTEFDKFCSDDATNLFVRRADGFFQNGADGTEYDARAGLTGNRMRWAGPRGTQAYSNRLVPLFSPTPWANGSSGSHVDDTVFEGKLMVSAGGAGGKEARDVCPVEAGILQDLGYLFQALVQFTNTTQKVTPPEPEEGERARAPRAGVTTNWVWVTIIRTGDVETNGAVDYTTVPQSGKGWAAEGWDYLAASGTLAFAPGVITQAFPVAVLSDTNIGSTVESVQLILRNPQGGFVLGTVSNFYLRIVDEVDGVRQSVLSETFCRSNRPAGWSVFPTNGDPVWAFDNPGARPNRTGGSGGMAIADSAHAGAVDMDTALVTPPLDLASFDYVNLEFNYDFYYFTNGAETLTVEISTNGMDGPWEPVWDAPDERYPIPSYKTYEETTNAVIMPVRSGNFRGPALAQLDISEWVDGAGQALIRFVYADAHSNGWAQIDNVRVFGNIDYEQYTNDVPGQLPAWWQAIFFHGDPTNEPGVDADSDGYSNYEELVAGTDPTDADYRPEIDEIDVQIGQNRTLIAFWAEPGRTYALSYSNRATGGWSALASGLRGDADFLEVTNPSVGSAQYRLEVTARGYTNVIRAYATATNRPAPASGLTATAGQYSDRVNVAWQDVPAALYQVFRGTNDNPGSATSLGIIGGTAMTDLGVGLYQIYYYWVQTCDMLDGMGTGLVGPVVGYASDIELGVRTALEVTWPSQVGTNYVVQWTTNMSSGPWLFVTNVTGAAGTSSVLRSLQPGPRGYYRVIVE